MHATQCHHHHHGVKLCLLETDIQGGLNELVCKEYLALIFIVSVTEYIVSYVAFSEQLQTVNH